MTVSSHFPARRVAAPLVNLAAHLGGLALCLALATALLTAHSAQAADKADPAATKPDPAKAVRPDVAKAINGSRDLISANSFQPALDLLKPSLALTDLSPYESYLLHRLQGIALVGLGQMAAADPVQEAVAADPQLDREDRLKLERLMAQRWYDKEPLSQAIKWARRFMDDGGKDDTMYTIIAQSQYKGGDCAGVIETLKAGIAAGDAENKAPSEARLNMLGNCQGKVKDEAGRIATLERTATLYPKPAYWNNLLAAAERKPSFEDYAVLDAYRLRMATDTMAEAADYIDMAKLALRAGYPAEAKRALDTGVAKGVLGEGKGGAEYDTVRKTVDKQTDEDLKALGQGDARAESAKDGNALFSGGLNYVTHEKYDLGLPMMVRGLERGGVKRPELAKLELGDAYVRAGRKDEALKAFATVNGGDGSADLARIWTLFVQSAK